MTTSRWPRASVDQRRVDRLDPARVDDGDADALVGEQRRRSSRQVGASAPTLTSSTSGRLRRGRAVQHVDAADPADRGDSSADGALGKRTTVGPSSTADRLAQLGAHRVGVARRGDPQAGHDLQDRHVPHAVVARRRRCR